ncbi:hypothetical protein FSP39_015130 [Pinctada imbricata]|uniref:Uncharacterized protein n=1 Tax=Pinctada imbricata TaxID=66713 RepID=A0AA88Y0P2_PINIB|nr:hypothetical protein FSP39_015130 [Pinctada imbricata]
MMVVLVFCGRWRAAVLFLLHCLPSVISQAQLNVNNFFNDLAGNSMNSINPLGKLPNAMTMSKQCKFGADMSGPIQYMQMDAMSSNLLSSYIGGNRQCPCMMTVDTSGCPVCNCKDKKATTSTVKTPEQRHKLRRNTTRFHPSQASTPKSTHVKIQVPNSTSNSVTHSQTTTVSTHFTQSSELTSSRLVRQKPSEKQNNTYSKAVRAEHIDPQVQESYSFPLFILFSCTTALTLVSSFVLLYLWRKSKKTLKHEKNELYFVEKSIRNSSIVSSLLESDKSPHRESVYSHVENDLRSITGFDSNHSKISPELPPRTPPGDNLCLQLTPTAPPLTPVAGQTSFKFPPDDIRHDYLELI